MKNIAVIVLMLVSFNGLAQFKSANLQAAGLTCALCSRSINKSLEKLSFIQSVTPDIKSSSFSIVFKPGATVQIDEMKQAVEDAGFSVAKLKITGAFKSVKVQNDAHVTIDGRVFHFINTSNQTLEGDRTITLADKDFVSAKEFKKLSTGSKLSCVQTGKAGSCCTKEGIQANTRIYHVTI